MTLVNIPFEKTKNILIILAVLLFPNYAKNRVTTVCLFALVCKNQTNSKFRGKGEKFDFFLILILDRLDYN